MNRTQNDSIDGWEFKIVRSHSGKFKNYEFIKQVCDEESRNGWELVEKFDSSRLRFKRRTDRRSNDGLAQIDPYRDHVGISEGGLVLTILGIVFGSIGIIMLIVYTLKGFN